MIGKDKEKEEIILNAINGSWKDFYPLNENEKKEVQKEDTFMKVLKGVDDGTIILK